MKLVDEAPVWLECSGCGRRVPLTEPHPFACPAARAGDDVDHVLVRRADHAAALRFPATVEGSPYLALRELYSYAHRARALGVSEVELLALVEGLDAAVAAVDGRGFSPTPLRLASALVAKLGAPAVQLWAKDDTCNVSGSHKARHLMGVMIHLRLAEIAGLHAAAPRRRLAIASCGNAALAAAVVARAARWPLDVFVPPDADGAVLERLQELDAHVTSCPRDGEPGDPCYRAFKAALQRGALPFGVQGTDNGMAVEGGMTLGHELADQARHGPGRLDAVVIQVGGGALGSACLHALRDAVALGVLPAMPRLHTVQTHGAWPLRRAYERVVQAIVARSDQAPPAEPRARADWLLQAVPPDVTDEVLRHAATHRSAFMWPWETTPRSVAHGILDDETYDWWALVEGMIHTGGFPVVADEPTLVEAREAVRRTLKLEATATGTAGIAGVMHLHRTGALRGGEVVAALLTGRER